MTGFARVKGGDVVAVADTKQSLPSTWRYDDGRTVSGFRFLADDEILAAGWVPLRDVKPTPGKGQRLAGPETTIGDREVVRTWRLEAIPEPPPPSAASVRLGELRTKVRAGNALTPAEVSEAVALALGEGTL